MQIKDMFRKKIDREIQGVIIVGQGEETNVAQELDVYKRQILWWSSWKTTTSNTSKMLKDYSFIFFLKPQSLRFYCRTYLSGNT